MVSLVLGMFGGQVLSGDFDEHVKHADRAYQIARQAAQIATTRISVCLEQLFAGGDGVVQLGEDLGAGHLPRLRDRLLLALPR